jgi:iron-sulfur cluster repair protein YtfE (RIC family)
MNELSENRPSFIKKIFHRRLSKSSSHLAHPTQLSPHVALSPNEAIDDISNGSNGSVTAMMHHSNIINPVESVDHRINENRYNPCACIHKGVRYALYSATCKAGNMDYECDDQALELIEWINDMDIILKNHASDEEAFLFKDPRVKNQPISSELSREYHEFERSYMEAIRQQTQLLESAVNDTAPLQTKEEIGNRLYLLLNDFMVDYLSHMKREENELIPRISNLFTDRELKDIQSNMMKSVDPEIILKQLKYMFPPMSHKERVSYIADCKRLLPRSCYCEVKRLISQSISSDEEYERIMHDVEYLLDI